MNFSKTTSRNKVLATAIVAILLLSMLSFVITPASAADRQPYAFLSARPNPVGVNQTVLIVMWLDMLPGVAYPGVATANWKNFTLTITSPDGHIETVVQDSDPAASTYVTWIPTQTGNYTLNFRYPGETIAGNNYLPSTAPNITLVVQTDPIPDFPTSPLPSGYWSRPIQASNREWATIANNWYGVPILFGNTWAGGSNWVPNGTAPDSAHILWTKEKEIGGLVGGEFGDIGFYSGGSYENKWTPPVIIDGRLYYNQRLGSSSNLGLVCVDLATGEELWFQNGTTITCGQVLNFDAPNQHGAFAYLWSMGTTYRLYDAFTGIEILQIVNATTGRIRFDEAGNLLVYVLNGQQNRLTLWNSTKCIVAANPGNPYGWQWRPVGGGRLDWSTGIEWNVSVPDVPGVQTISTMGENVIIAANSPETGIISVTGYSTVNGTQFWNFNLTSVEPAGYFFTSEVDGRFAWFRQETMQWTAFNAYTGERLWGPTEPYSNAWGMYTSSVIGLGASSPVIAYGKLYAVAYDGMIHCYDMETGHNDWNYFIGNAGYETPYGTWPLAGGLHVVADGKVYATTGEHSPNHPLIRGAKIVCVNATTGDEIWRSTGWLQTPAIADGTLVAFNHYDNRIYAFGKGASSVTVTAPDALVTSPTKILIKGTVTDISPGTNENEQAMRFPSGVPVVSDASMSGWMEYVYMQGVRPENITGVTITLDVLDANGNYRPIGETVSDANGFFSYEWEPDIAGKFTVYATFGGSNSYWPAYAVTAFTVSDAPSASSSPDGGTGSVADAYFIPAVIGIIAAIIIVGIILALLLLRRRP
jgi:hypothetical protein